MHDFFVWHASNILPCHTVKDEISVVRKLWELKVLVKTPPKLTSQPAQDVKTTLLGRCYDVKTIKQCCIGVILTSCAGWFFFPVDDDHLIFLRSCLIKKHIQKCASLLQF